MQTLMAPVRSSGQREAKIRDRVVCDTEKLMKLVSSESLSTLQLDPAPPEHTRARGFQLIHQESSDREAVLYFAALDKTGKVRRALDGLYDLVHGLVKMDEFDRCDRLFVDVPADRLGVQLAVGLLTVTMRFKTRLPARAAFLRAAREALSQSAPEKSERLFANLE